MEAVAKVLNARETRPGVRWVARSREWMTRDQVAAHLQVSTRTVARWGEAGLPSHKRCNVVRYDRAEVDAWMNGAG